MALLNTWTVKYFAKPMNEIWLLHIIIDVEIIFFCGHIIFKITQTVGIHSCSNNCKQAYYIYILHYITYNKNRIPLLYNKLMYIYNVLLTFTYSSWLIQHSLKKRCKLKQYFFLNHEGFEGNDHCRKNNISDFLL